jgi:transposase-like protein
VFEGKHFRPAQAVLLLRGVCKGEPTAAIAREIGVTRQTAHDMRKAIQANAERLQLQEALPDQRTETDEMFQNAGGKGERHDDPDDPPRRRANKRRGHGTYDKDRPPIAGTFGRESRQVRLRVVHPTDKEALVHHVHMFTKADAVVFTDEWQSYNHIIRLHSTVCHSEKEWARDDDGDGICEVHINTAEGMWTTVRNFLHSFRGVHKKYLSSYV